MPPTITTEGRRIYIQTAYGDPCVAALKSLGAHWDSTSKRWWITSAKEAAVREAIANSAGQPAPVEEIMVCGKAQYRDRAYYVRWTGITRGGEHKARLCTLDGKVDFWADVAEGEAQITKTYQKPRTLQSIRDYIEELHKPDSPDDERKTCWECGCEVTCRQVQLRGGDWNEDVAGAGTCYCGC